MRRRLPENDSADPKLIAALKKLRETSYCEDKRSYNVRSASDEGREEFRRWAAAVNKEILGVGKPYTIREATTAMEQVGNLDTSLKALGKVIRSLREEGFPQVDESHYTVGEAWDDIGIFMEPTTTLIRYLEARKWRGERPVPENLPTGLRRLVVLVESLIYTTALLYAKDASRHKILDRFAKLGSETQVRTAMVLEADDRFRAHDNSLWVYKRIYRYGR